nr:hypothetical protein [uncultured Desulfuromonas sp.]
MKNIVILLLLVFPVMGFAESIKYRSDIKPKHYNDVWKKQYDSATRIDYDPEKDTFDFYIKESLYLVGFTLSRAQANDLIQAIDKYKEWNIKASNKGVTLEKEISQFQSSGTFWQVGNGDWSFGDGVNISTQFFSLNTKVHQLVIFFPKFVSKYNQYSSHRPDELYFSYSEALKLRDALKPEEVSKFMVKAKKQAEIDAEFN